MTLPLFSIILICYEQECFLESCIDSIYQQSEHSFELFVVDNHSSDRSVATLKKLQKLHGFQLICNDKNVGFGPAINQVYPQASGSFVCIGNVDIRMDSVFVENASKYLFHSQSDVFVPKLLLLKSEQTIDSLGVGYNPWSLKPYDIEQYQPDQNQFPDLSRLLGPSGALAIYRKESLDRLIDIDGYLFDPSIHLYFEDVDLALRCRKHQFTVEFQPDLKAWHDRCQSYSQTPDIEIQAYLNRLYVLKKNFSLRDWFHGFPINVCWELLRFLKLGLRHPALFKAVFRK